ncbi:WGR domain-containing protein [Ensifer oleiphilus]
MARYYALSIQRNLFGEICLIRSWGRVGTLGQQLSHHFASETEAVALLHVFARQKTAKGYVSTASLGRSTLCSDIRGVALPVAQSVA